MRQLLVPAVIATLAAIASPARADDASCIQSYESTQTLRKASKLREARAEAAKCAVSTCPAVLSKDCQRWQTELDNALPTVVFDVKGSAGEALSNVKITANGQPLVDKIDGSPVTLDAGETKLHFESPDGHGLPADQTVTLKEGEKAHKVAVTLGGKRAAAPVTQAPAPAAQPFPLGPVIFGAAGIVAVGVGAVFAITGHSSESDLDTCKPHCPASDVNSVSTKYAISDILFTAGAVSLVAAAYMFITRPAAAPTPAVGTFKPRRGLVLEF
jgi:hypothetical protein